MMPVVKNLLASAGEAGHAGSIPRLGKLPGGGHRQPTPVFLPGQCYGQRSLTAYSP